MKKFNKFFIYFLIGGLTPFLFFIYSQHANASTEITEDILSNTNWTQSNSPYIVQNTIVIVPEAVLTIDPGVIVKFEPYAYVSIIVLGGLVVNGTINNMVYFTSNYDDSVGGDTGGEFDEPNVGDWNGINFIDSHNNYIKNTVFKYSNNMGYLENTYLNLKNVEIFDSNDGFITNISNIDADQVNCNDLSGSCLTGSNSSNINWKNSIIETSSSDSIDIFNSSTLNISNTTIKNYNTNFSSEIVVFNDSSVIGNHLNFYDSLGLSSDFVTIFNNSHFTLSNSSMLNCPSNACIEVFDGSSYLNTPSTLNIKNSSFSGGSNDGIMIFGDSNIISTIQYSRIMNFTGFSINTFGDEIKTINAKNNFWGNETGPFHPIQNPNGTAGVVSDYVNFIPWCISVEECQMKNPVILIPGIMGSEIFKNYDDLEEIWPNVNTLVTSFSDNFLNDLSFNTDGSENYNKPMRVEDIIRKTTVNILGFSYTTHIFDGLIDELSQNGYIENSNLFVFPYDWRKSNSENAILLKNKIEEILNQTGNSKVNLIAHSMGGLVAKKYIADNPINSIDHLIFIGTPHLGAPKTFKALMYGDDMGINIGGLSLLNPNRIKMISQNMPGAFDLLPSKKYVDGQPDFIGEKYITDLITNPDPSFNSELNYEQTKDFMIIQGRNSLMFPFAENLHNNIDNLNFDNLNVTNFSGCGISKTIGHITAKKKNPFISQEELKDDYDLGYTNGDSTVPLHSSILSNVNQFYVKEFSHSKLPSASGLKENIISILKNEIPTVFPNISSEIEDCYVSGKVLNFNGSVELHIYDKKGNHTGFNEEGQFENNILGVQYDEILDNKSIFLPDNMDYRIVIKPKDLNVFDLLIKSIDKNDNERSLIYWDKVKSESSKNYFEINLSILSKNIPKLFLLEDGNKFYKKEISSALID